MAKKNCILRQLSANCNIQYVQIFVSFLYLAVSFFSIAFSALTLLVGVARRPVKTEWWRAGVVICLERDADSHMAQLMPLPLTVSCFSKIQMVFTFLVPAHPGSPGKRAVKRVCVPQH